MKAPLEVGGRNGPPFFIMTTDRAIYSAESNAHRHEDLRHLLLAVNGVRFEELNIQEEYSDTPIKGFAVCASLNDYLSVQILRTMHHFGQEIVTYVDATGLLGYLNTSLHGEETRVRDTVGRLHIISPEESIKRDAWVRDTLGYYYSVN